MFQHLQTFARKINRTPTAKNICMKKRNFSAGPCILPESVMKKASEAVVELDGIGLSIIEISHRSKEFVAIMEKALSGAAA